MPSDAGLSSAAQLFKVLGNESRLHIVLILADGPQTVGALAETTGLSQPLASQHLRTLRDAHVVASTRQGKAVLYRVADHHISHVIEDAFVHVNEARPDGV